jgi:hypothetical protein
MACYRANFTFTHLATTQHHIPHDNAIDSNCNEDLDRTDIIVLTDIAGPQCQQIKSLQFIHVCTYLRNLTQCSPCEMWAEVKEEYVQHVLRDT